jgi:hypothetical protein
MEEAQSNGKRMGSVDWFGRNGSGDRRNLSLLVLEEQVTL